MSDDISPDDGQSSANDVDASIAGTAASAGVSLAIANDRRRMAAIARLVEEHDLGADFAVLHIRAGTSVDATRLAIIERARGSRISRGQRGDPTCGA